MKKWYLPILLLFLLQNAEAQLGLTVAPTSSALPKWEVLVENFVTERRTNFMEYGVTGLVDYRLPLKEKRWSFQPSIHAFSSSFSHQNYHFDLRSVGILPNLNFEFSNMEAKKSIRPFLQFSPGIHFFRHRFDRPIELNNQFSGKHDRFAHNSWALSFGLHFMLDIKLTNLLTVSPNLGYRYFPKVKWEGITSQVTNETIPSGLDDSEVRQLIFGLRFGLDLENGRR